MKYDNDKPRYDLIPQYPLEEVAKVFTMGAKKYGENNWRDDASETSFGRTMGSILRHIYAFQSGEDIDPESNLNHLAHAITQLMILMVQQLEAPGMDDRRPIVSESNLHNSSSYNKTNAVGSKSIFTNDIFPHIQGISKREEHYDINKGN